MASGRDSCDENVGCCDGESIPQQFPPESPPKSVAEPHQTLPAGTSGFGIGVNGPDASTITGDLGMSPQTPPRSLSHPLSHRCPPSGVTLGRFAID